MFVKGKIRNLWLFSLFADLAAIIAAYHVTLWLRFSSEWGGRVFTAVNRSLGVRESGELGAELQLFYESSAPRIMLILLGTLGILYALRGLYSGRTFIRWRSITWDVFVANLIALGFFYAYFYLSRNVFHPRSIFACVMILNCMLCVFFRGWINELLWYVRARFGIDQWRTLLVGSGPEAETVARLLRRNQPHGLRLDATLAYDPGQPFDELVRAVKERTSRGEVDFLILADPRFSISQIMELLDVAESLAGGIPVKVLSDKMEVLVNQSGLPVDMIQGIPLVHFDIPRMDAWITRIRLGVERGVAWVLLALSLPLMGLIALCIRLTSPGSAFFVQDRIGVNRQPFRMFKFRTMYHWADELQAQVEEFNESGLGLFKIRKDPRVTPVGRFLRRFSLDEIPQLLNVVRGDMRLVGPRPLPQRDFENYYEEWHYSRHDGMPGITCLWQVSGRSDIDFHNMCILDVYYLRNQNWALDVRILIRTLEVVIFAKGAY